MPVDYFIRSPDSDQAQGPFSKEQLLSLVEAGKVDRETMYFNKQMEVWVTIGDDAEMIAMLFPEKKRLSLKPKTEELAEDGAPVKPAKNVEAESAAKVKVTDLLAAAEAESEDTRHIKELMASRNLAAAKAPAILATLLLAAVASHLPVLLPTLDNLYGQAFFYLAAFDLILGLLVALSVSEVFPVIRIRAGLGFGFFGYLAYADIVSGVPDAGLQLAAISIYSLALFLATFILHYHFLMFIWFAGLAAKVAYIWLRYGEEFANLF